MTSSATREADMSPRDSDVSILLSGATLALPIATLIIFDLVVVIGNSLVMIAVHTLPRLKATVNLFIVSLAASDLAIGLLVLPLSSVYEVLTYWPFGSVLCSAWLAVDVWLCTASILNLCAISLDRYLAVSRPFRYPELMSARRSKMLVCSVWCLAFLVCLPPLIGWREPHHLLQQQKTSIPITFNISHNPHSKSNNNYITSHPITTTITYYASVNSRDFTAAEFSKMTSLPTSANNHSYVAMPTAQCLLTSERGYVVYSALTSFWLPASVMLAFYWLIYRVAATSSAALRRGEIRASTVPDALNSPMTLRVHRGTSSPCVPDLASGGGVKRHAALGNGTPSPACRGRLSRGPRKQNSLDSALTLPRVDDCRRRESALSEQVSCRRSMETGSRDAAGKGDADVSTATTSHTAITTTISHPSSFDSVQPLIRKRSNTISSLEDTPKRGTSDVITSTAMRRQRMMQQRAGSRSGGGGAGSVGSAEGGTAFAMELVTCDTSDDVTNVKDADQHHKQQQLMHQQQQQRKGTVFQLKAHAKRFKKEQKAAKTVGVIVGCFVLCWAPFFTVYLLGAFCPLCTPQIAFRIFFWLGYCNSAINPFVYALFSHDYRTAFKKLLACKWRRRRSSFDHRPSRHSRSSRLISSFISSVSVRFRASASRDIDDNS